MSTPSMLVGAALVFWGWQSGWLWLGVLTAALLESSRFIRARWEFAQADFDRVWNLCALLFFGAIVVLFITNDGASAVTSLVTNNSLARRSEALNQGSRSVIQLLLWQPMILLPIVVVQAFSQRERMDWSTFSWWLRRQRKVRGSAPAGSGVNVAWPYFAICLLAASAANEQTMRFSIGFSLLVGWSLWARRPRRFSVVGWAACLLAVIGLGLALQSGLRQLQMLVRQLDGALVARFAGGRGFSPKETQTAIGAVGRLKLSGSIVLRVEADGSPPQLLREASYKLFRSPFWVAPRQNFSAVIPESDFTTWKLLPDKPAQKVVTIAGYLPGGQGLLAVPHGVSKIEDLPAVQFQTNRLGVLQVLEGPGFTRFRATYSEGTSIDSPPDENDRDIPMAELPAIAKLAEELELRGQPPEEVLKRVHRFLNGEFSYTTWQEEGRRRRSLTNESALARFLLQTRAGHCEHFATATVMLLRAAGVPARYAVGYAVSEKKGAQWIVRERHAHAWCLAWANGAWHDVDNTPGSWTNVEAARAGFWENISDAWSRVWYEFSKWRWGKGEWKRYLIWLVVPLIGLAVWRLMTQKQWSRARNQKEAKSSRAAIPGLDSEFYLIERKLVERGLERREGETLNAWLSRIGRDDATGLMEVRRLLELHYRLRFDPDGINATEREDLRSRSAQWLERSTAAVARN